MVLDLKSISARLDKLREYLALLKEAQKMSLSVFKKDPRNYYTVERALQLARIFHVEALAAEADHDDPAFPMPAYRSWYSRRTIHPRNLACCSSAGPLDPWPSQSAGQ